MATLPPIATRFLAIIFWYPDKMKCSSWEPSYIQVSTRQITVGRDSDVCKETWSFSRCLFRDQILTSKTEIFWFFMHKFFLDEMKHRAKFVFSWMYYFHCLLRPYEAKKRSFWFSMEYHYFVEIANSFVVSFDNPRSRWCHQLVDSVRHQKPINVMS